MKNRKNAVYTEQAIAYDKIMPASYFKEFGDNPEHMERIPYGAEFLEKGYVRYTVFAPEAKEVLICKRDEIYPLHKNEKGMWTAELFLGYGYQHINIMIDGNEVIYPLLPIGYGFSRPINYIDVPEQENGFFEICQVPHGSVCSEWVYSSNTGKYEHVNVYLPPDYYQSKEAYPVLYLQHGHGENENCWIYQGKVNFIFDNLIAQGKAVPAIIVMCNGMIQTEGEDGRFIDETMLERMLIEDIIPYIDGKYRTKAVKEYRAMAGLSMGSMQTSMITMKHQDQFAYAGLFSGFMQDLMRNNNSHLCEEYLSTYNENMKIFFRAMGKDDEFIGTFLEDDEICKRNQIQCVRRLYEGEHEWNVWRHCIYDFLQMLFLQEG